VVVAHSLEPNKFYPEDESAETGYTTTLIEVSQSWKTSLPKSITLFAKYGRCGGGISENSNYLLFLQRDQEGKYWLMGCGDYHEAGYVFHNMVQRVQQISACGCEKFDAQKAYDRADLIMDVGIFNIMEAKGKTLAIVGSRFVWKSDIPLNENSRLVVQLADQAVGCGYPVPTNYPEIPARIHLMYLHRDRNGNLYTGICSGNLFTHSESGWRKEWLDKHTGRKWR
jgi:hypothetical protein